MGLLDKVNEPHDLRKLRRSELPHLASEVRERILSVISESGGHLAPSLGAVELTIALHYVYKTPADKIIWDVGHQAYAHKILTGRNDRFPTVRQHGGISGFPSSDESEYDCFSVGHASTSISAALGMAEARDLRKEDSHIVAVIGDGAMTGGLAFEGLNNAGARKTSLTVILNDNSMSIARNVGAMSHYLTRVIADPLYNKVKGDLWKLTGRMAGLGSGIRRIVHSIDESIKHLVIPGKLFEDMGFRYFGVIDGHNLRDLVDVLRNVRGSVDGPVLIHVQTVKGKGFDLAERDATKFHGISPFERASGKVENKKGSARTYTQVFSDALVRFGKTHPNLVAVTAAMPDGTGLKHFGETFPGRLFDVGIAEGHAVTFAAGLARQGMRPVVALYSTFMQRAFDHIIHDVALTRLPIIFCLDRAGLVGDDGPTHHGYFDLSYLRMIPNMIVMAPKDEGELGPMLATALAREDGPCAIRYPRGSGLGLPLPEELNPLPIAVPEVLKKGKDVLLLALGDMVHSAMAATETLTRKKIKAGVVSARFAKPLDTPGFLSLYSDYGAIVTIESNTVVGGFGSGVAETINREKLGTRVLNLGYPDRFVEHGDKAVLLQILKLDPEGIAEQVKDWL